MMAPTMEDQAIMMRLMRTHGTTLFYGFHSASERSAFADWQLMKTCERIKADAITNKRSMQLIPRTHFI